MYIQDNALLHNRPCTGFATSMPELFHDGQYPTHTPWNAPKKRKRSDDDNEAPDFKKIISKPDHQLGLLNSPLTQQDNNQQSVTLLQAQNTVSPIYLHTPTQPLPKRRRPSQKTSPRSSPGRCSTAPPQLQTTDLPPPPLSRRISSPAISPKTVPISMLMLRACHICHRRPFTRTHLESYINCELCIERTCYICVRECGSLKCSGRVYESDGEAVEGSGARKVCSRCAVESGVDGEVVRCRECWVMENDSQVTDSDGAKWIQEPSLAHMDGMAGSLQR